MAALMQAVGDVMTSFAHCTWQKYVCAFLCALSLCIAPANALEVVPADVQAAVRTLGFIDSLQKRPLIVVSVVYKAGDADSKTLAQRTAAILAATKGPNGVAIDTNVVAANELGQMGRHVDVVYIVPGITEGRNAVADYVRRQRVLSISNDPACLNSNSCVLMVRAGARTEIVLDTSLAQASGATFSSVFMMMVKRR